MKILGISAFYHDSAAALVQDGVVLKAAQEERFTRRKHDNRFPKAAINWILNDLDLSINDIDHIVYYENPNIKFDRILKSFIQEFPKGYDLFPEVMVSQLLNKRWVKKIIAKELKFEGPIHYVDHHISHAASAFFASPFKEAAFLTVDGVGEWDTTTYGVGLDNQINIQKRIRFPHSLGLLYAAFTYFTGFKVNSGEYKVMGLAPYGEPKYVQKILDHLIDVKEDGSYRLNMNYFDYASGNKMTNEAFNQLFGRHPRRSESKITQDDMDLARSIQEVTEIVLIKMAKHIRKITDQRNLCLAGGVALNCVANGKILKEKIFNEIWIQPAAGDAGGALGAAFYHWHQNLNNPRVISEDRNKKIHSYYGPSYETNDVKEFLENTGIEFEESEDIAQQTAQLLAEGKIVGWFNGRMEFGPRALGSRSILGDPRKGDMQKTMNLKIKYRESFRPFAPSVLERSTNEWFQLKKPSPFMLLVTKVKRDKLKPLNGKLKKLFGIDKLNVERSEISAVTHVDNSARVQTVNKDVNGKYNDLLEAFNEITGCPVLINTSFNVRGEPIVCTPEDAYRCFMRTEMDYLVLENCLIDKQKQAKFKEKVDWRKEFVLD